MGVASMGQEDCRHAHSSKRDDHDYFGTSMLNTHVEMEDVSFALY